MWGRPLLVPLLPLLLAACSSSSGAGAELAFSGSPGQPVPAVELGDVLLVDATLAGTTSKVVVDTGSPVVNLDPRVFPKDALPAGSGTVSGLSVGDLVFADPPVVGASLINTPDPTIPLGGILGCGILCSFAVSWNYRDLTLTLGQAPPPANVAVPGVATGFALEGGGTFALEGVPGTVSFSASRISVTATVEGTPHAFIVDTGASFVFLRQAIFNQITRDGRAQIRGVSATTTEGLSSSSVTRLKSVVVGGAEVTALPASEDPSVENLLDGIGSEVGHPVEGLIGGSYLREFYVTVDYPARSLVLQRYATRDHITDEFERVGVAMTAPDVTGKALVTTVFPGTDATKLGVVAGDAITAIDGTLLRGLGGTRSSALLSGNVGAVKMVTFGAAKAPALSGQTVTIRVDELLPLP